MSNVENQAVEPQDNQEPAIDYQAKIAELEETIRSFDGIKKRNEELLNETKKAKQERIAADTEKARIAEEKAQKDGEFEKLWQTAKKKEDELTKRLAEIQNNNRQEKITIAAMKVANELADGDNAELLSDFVTRKLEKLADETGALGADVLESVRDEFKGNQKYKSLLRGSKAIGGGAVGNMRGAQESKMTKESWEKAAPDVKMKVARELAARKISLEEYLI